MKKCVLGIVLIVLVAVSVTISGSSRECINCGVNCAPGSCDDSIACSQCLIYDCIFLGGPGTLICGTLPPI